MTYQVLARRLRPQRFADVVGQEHVTATLQAALRAGRVAHAFLLTGPRGVGKTTTARLLAKALNCEAGPAPEPCNACTTCHEIAEGIAFDVLEIDGASHTQVDKMRDLMEAVAHRPMKSRFKIYIIDEVHMLSQHSFNALLKTLEEPPAHAKFVLATTDPHKVLPTVVSRCQRYDLRRIGMRELTAHLERTTAAEGVQVASDVLALVAREAQGSLRDAQSLLEQLLATGEAALDADTARALLGAADRRLVVTIMDAVLARDPAACLAQLETLHTHGYDPQRLCRDLLEHVRHLTVFRTTGARDLLGALPEAEVEAIVRQAEAATPDELQRAFQLLLEADEALATPTRTIDPQLLLEMRIVRLATLEPLLPVAEILERLEALEASSGAGARGLQAPSGGGVRATAPGAGGAPLQSGPAAGTPPVPTGAAGASTIDGQWEAFLARVRRERVALYMTLAAGRPLGLESGVLRIGLESESMRRSVQGRESLELLGRLASDALGSPTRVEIGPLPAERESDTQRARARQREQETLADPLVQAAVEIFGGEVRAVRERPS
ncbi:MAG TPA: DNA polymerase III subunit gamma/tau [Candidatus Limnocylindria bacterium]|nr:DNA polymerase III subunit gamma/tau [Candidatus Limnocylindria bacterium]